MVALKRHRVIFIYDYYNSDFVAMPLYTAYYQLLNFQTLAFKVNKLSYVSNILLNRYRIKFVFKSTYFIQYQNQIVIPYFRRYIQLKMCKCTCSYGLLVRRILPVHILFCEFLCILKFVPFRKKNWCQISDSNGVYFCTSECNILNANNINIQT